MAADWKEITRIKTLNAPVYATEDWPMMHIPNWYQKEVGYKHAPLMPLEERCKKVIKPL